MRADRGNAAAWHRLVIAVLGGDEREQEICRCAAATGAQVRAFGFPWPPAGIDGVHAARDAAEAISGANVALMPIPGIAADGSLFATARIVPEETLLAFADHGSLDDRLEPDYAAAERPSQRPPTPVSAPMPSLSSSNATEQAHSPRTGPRYSRRSKKRRRSSRDKAA